MIEPIICRIAICWLILGNYAGLVVIRSGLWLGGPLLATTSNRRDSLSRTMYYGRHPN